MQKQSKPTIALTVGDPAGVGPEIIVGVWPDSRLHSCCNPLVVGPSEIVRRAAKLSGIDVDIVSIQSPNEAKPSPSVIPVLACGSDDVLNAPAGQIDPRSGQAAYDAVVTATRLALSDKVDAITTAPLHKEALHLAGHPYPGHTELLAEMCNVSDFAMMLYLAPSEVIQGPGGLAVVHVTLHSSIRSVLKEITEDKILAKAHLANQFMTPVIGHRPRIGVCALNPHGGEGGLFGDEEKTIIRPAVEKGLSEGLQLEGPLPTDTLMISARDGKFDAIVAMYHDQGHIALKLLGMHSAVNVTLGLPIIRTSVAHGTAFDIAWKGNVQLGSMFEAVRVAAKLAMSKRSSH